MQRRNLLRGAGAAILAPLVRPALASDTRTLVFVPQAPLTSIDPVWTSAMVTRNFGMLVFETLYGRDAVRDEPAGRRCWRANASRMAAGVEP